MPLSQDDIEAALTDPQRLLLERVRAEGRLVTDGKARRSAVALEEAELVTLTIETVPSTRGRHVDRLVITAR